MEIQLCIEMSVGTSGVSFLSKGTEEAIWFLYMFAIHKYFPVVLLLWY